MLSVIDVVKMYSKEIPVPETVTIEISGKRLSASGPKGKVERMLEVGKEIKTEKVNGKFRISSESEKREIKSLIGTTVAHIRNAIEGVTKGFVYRLRVVYSHFPITVKVEGRNILIQNFLGERVPRIAKIFGDTQVRIEGQDLIVSGTDVDQVSQTAANIEQATRIVGYDKKIFQDGIWIVSKGG